MLERSKHLQNAYQCQAYGTPDDVTSGPSKFELNLAGEDIDYGLRLEAAHWSKEEIDSETSDDLGGS